MVEIQRAISYRVAETCRTSSGLAVTASSAQGASAVSVAATKTSIRTVVKNSQGTLATLEVLSEYTLDKYSPLVDLQDKAMRLLPDLSGIRPS
jgi:hypothetical protein